MEITFYPGGTLTSPPRAFDGVLKDVSDMAMIGLHFTRGRFPVMEAIDLPLGFPSGWVSTHVINDFYSQYKPKELDDVHTLYFHACGPNVIWTSKVPVNRLGDLKGLQIRGTGRIADSVKALGAIPVPIEMADAYDSLSRGVIDGIMIPLEAVKGWSFGEAVKYVTECWQVGNV